MYIESKHNESEVVNNYRIESNLFSYRTEIHISGSEFDCINNINV